MRNPQKCGFFYFISEYLYKNINRMNSLDDLLTALITGQHGWTVGEQFERTWDGSQSVEDQNAYAMEKIVETLEGLVSSELLSKWAVIDIVTYIRRVKEDLARQDEEDEDEEPTDDNQNLQEQISRIKGMMKVIEEQSVCDKFQLIDRNQFLSDVKDMKFSKGSDTDEAKNLVMKSKKIYKFNGSSDEANKNLNCIGLTLYKSKNYDYYEPNLFSGGSSYLYIGVW